MVMEKEEKKEKKDTFLSDVLLQLYNPAISMADADDYLTATEIIEALSEFITPDKKKLFNCLTNLGFRSVNINNTLYWLVNFNN